MPEPSFLHLYRTGELERRAKTATEWLATCAICPRQCGVDRTVDETGVCKTGRLAHVASYNLHFGEEAPLVGEGGSGTIFFACCNLGCVFCQNWDISHEVEGSLPAAPEQLAAVMLELQNQGAHNINFVTPTHVTPQILEALPVAAQMGLTLPLVYNCSGYESLHTLQLLDGVVDIYMPDAKFLDPKAARQFCDAPDYPDAARAAMKEMHRQVGDLQTDSRGVAWRGLLVRHLVMPGGAAQSEQWFRFIADELSPGTYVNVMEQYRPCGRADEFAEISRPLPGSEHEAALAAARKAGLTRLDDRQSRLAYRLLRHYGR